MKLNVHAAPPGPQPELPPQAISGEVLLEKYAKGDERTVEDVRRRVARALAMVESPDKRAACEATFYRAQADGLVLGGRINSAAGTQPQAPPIHCFLQPVRGQSSAQGGGVGNLA